jgi:ADP-ribose pyrophosphatase YjhB (NUDIX family)
LKLEDLHVVNQPQLVCDSCEFIFYLDPKLAVSAVVLHEDKVLLLKRAEEPERGKWGLPGGYVSRGERFFDAIVNEVLEEAGVLFRNEGILDLLELSCGQGFQIIFWGKTGDREPMPNIESFEARFFAFKDIPWNELAFAATAAALRRSISLCRRSAVKPRLL